jgi:Flp pilus assembly protein CpaB
LRRTSRLILLLGIFLAAITFIVIFALNLQPATNGPQASAPPASLDTVIAAKDIPLGTVVTADMVSKQSILRTSRDPKALGDPSLAIGKTARKAITAGAQVLSSDFQTGTGTTTLDVPVGMRGFALEVNQLTGVGNLINVGDTVDVVISLAGGAFPVVQRTADGGFSVVSGLNPLSVKLPLLLEDIQVIGVLDAPAASTTGQAAAPAASGAPAAAPRLTGASRLIVLAVTPAQAEVLVFARDLNPEATLGNPDHVVSQVDIVLRSPLDKGVSVATDGVILKTLIDKYGVLPPQLVQTVVPIP